MKYFSKKRIGFLLLIVCVGFTFWITEISKARLDFSNYIRTNHGFFNQDNYEFDPLEFKQISEEMIDAIYENKLDRVEKGIESEINWNKYAYVNYVTTLPYLCLTMMSFSALLNEHKTKAKLVILVSNTEEMKSLRAENMLLKIQDMNKDQVIIKKVKNFRIGNDESTWVDSLSKLHIFNQTEFDRIIYMDSDSIVKKNMDELFFLPDYVTFAAALSYWFLQGDDLKQSYEELKRLGNSTNLVDYNVKVIDKINKDEIFYNDLPNLPHNLYLKKNDIYYDILNPKKELPLSDSPVNPLKPGKVKFASDLMVLKPSKKIFKLIKDHYLPIAQKGKRIYDMDLIDEYLFNLRKMSQDHFINIDAIKSNFVPELLILPFTRYGIISQTLIDVAKQELIRSHGVLGYNYLDSAGEDKTTSLDELFENAKYIHYSDGSLKPWYKDNFESIHCKIKNKDLTRFNKEQEERMCSYWYRVHKTYFDNKSICG